MIWGYRKLGNLTSKHTKINVCKKDCTCARNILSFYLLYVDEIAKNGCFVVQRYAVREAKTWRSAVHKAEIGRHAVRKGVSPSWKWIVVHALSFIRFRIPDQVYCNKSQKNNNLLVKTFILQNKCPPPLLHKFGSALHSPFMWMIVFMLKEDRCKCEWKPTNIQHNTYV